MTIKFCVLNLTKSVQRSRKELNIGDLSLGDATVPIERADDIPTDRGSLILYIVGHAVPDALLVPAGGTLPDDDLVGTIMRRRGDNPTLIIWDFCFARSFGKVKNRGWTKKPYVHIFSCQAHEQSWHTGPDPDHPFRTVFSLALQEVLDDGIEDWFDLKDKLQGLLGRVQHPSIRLPVLHTDFGFKPRQAANVAQLRPELQATGGRKKSPATLSSKERQPKRGGRSAAARPSTTSAGRKKRRRRSAK
jgi:hypothetical protein